MNWLRWLCPASKRVSRRWLRDLDSREARIESHGVCWQWPVKKILNESPLWNRAKLRRSA